MVLLTMTATTVEALQKLHSLVESPAEPALVQKEETRGSATEAAKEYQAEEQHGNNDASHPNEAAKTDEKTALQHDEEPDLSKPRIGSPILHSQIVDLWKDLKAQNIPTTLDSLLRGARIYVAPPKPKPEPTSEYKALMARLRREEEARSYERMINPPPPMETFSQRFPRSSAAHAFSSQAPVNTSNEDEVTYADVDREMTLIFNVLISVVACAAAIWIAGRWWSTPTRLALSMGGSLLVAVAEVVVYAGYIRRVGEAKGKEKSIKEVREVVKTWMVGAGERLDEADSTLISHKNDPDNGKALRQRKPPS